MPQDIPPSISPRARVILWVFAFLGLAAYGVAVAWLLNGFALCFRCLF